MAVGARAEHVGSLLRRDDLLAARSAHAAGELSSAEFKAIEDGAVRDVVALQRDAGCPVVTDGELRRESFQAEFTAAVDGVRGAGMDAWLAGEWHSDVAGDLHVERPAELAVVEPLRKRRNLAAEEFTFLRACLGDASAAPGSGPVAKMTLPSPSLFASLWSPEQAGNPYRRSTTSWPTWWGSSATRCGNWSGWGAAISSWTPRTTRCSWIRGGGRSTRSAAGRSNAGSPTASNSTTP